MIFKTGIEAYCHFLAMAGRADATIASYRTTLKRLSNALPMGTRWEEIGVERVLAILSQRNCASATRNRECATLKSFSKWAFEAGYANCHRLAGLPRQRGCGRMVRALPAGEIAGLFAAIRNSNDSLRWRDEALFALYLATGLRRGEAAALRWEDLDVEQGSLLVRSKKTGRSRLIRLGPRMLAILLSLRRHSAGDCDGAVFGGAGRDRPLSGRQVNERFRYWREKAGMNQGGVGPQRLRVHYATALYQNSGDVGLVASSLGHLDLRSTLRYLAVAGERALTGDRLLEDLGLGKTT